MHPALLSAHAVIFDFDGVLADSEPLHMHAIAEVARTRGWCVTHEQFLAMIGKGDAHAFEMLAADEHAHVTPDEIAALVALKARLCMDGITEGRYTVQPGAPELVRAMSERLPTAVCSGSLRPFILGMLTKMELLPFLKAVVGHEDVANPKPHPEPYLLAAKRLGVEPARCVVIEDSPTGIRSAVDAGMTVIAVEHSLPASRLSAATLVVPRIADLLV